MGACTAAVVPTLKSCLLDEDGHPFCTGKTEAHRGVWAVLKGWNGPWPFSSAETPQRTGLGDQGEACLRGKGWLQIPITPWER